MSLKTVKKGNTVIMCGFTGINFAILTVEASDMKTITSTLKNGKKVIFSRATGKQINIEEGKKERFANFIKEDDGSYRNYRAERKAAIAEATKQKAPAKKKAEPPKKTKKAAPVQEVEEIEDEPEGLDELVDEIVNKKKPAAKAKTTPKKKAKKKEQEEEYEELE